MKLKLNLTIILLIGFSTFLFSQSKHPGKYIEWEGDKNNNKIIEVRQESERIKQKETEEIIQNIREQKANKPAYSFKADISNISIPESIEEFNTAFHFPPAPQDLAQCCWSYTTTSMFESEIFRMSGKKIKLSEMYSVYYEHLERVERLIDTRGESFYGEGSQVNALIRLYKKYGIVPYEAYTGKFCCNVEGINRRDYVPMYEEIKSYINWVKENNLWDKKTNLDYVKTILNKHMGTPPETVIVNGKELTPKEFYETLNLQVDNYISLMSTLKYPFYEYHVFPYNDNWWENADYLNVPINEYYNALKEAVKNGYTVGIAGDLSQEPGLYYYDKGVGIIPEFDIPEEYINQDSREFRMYNRTTVDDHAVQIVGYTQKDGYDWFIIKETGDPGRESNHRGYIYYRGDYIKLKVLYYFVHKDAVKDLLNEAK